MTTGAESTKYIIVNEETHEVTLMRPDGGADHLGFCRCGEVAPGSHHDACVVTQYSMHPHISAPMPAPTDGLVERLENIARAYDLGSDEGWSNDKSKTIREAASLLDKYKGLADAVERYRLAEVQDQARVWSREVSPALAAVSEEPAVVPTLAPGSARRVEERDAAHDATHGAGGGDA